MEVAQDPKPAIKEQACAALKQCCSVIDNADVYPLIDTVISANLNPDEEGESCLDKLVATTYVSAVDEPTLSIIIPVLMRGLRVKGNVQMVRKSAVVVDTMFKLVNNPRTSPSSLRSSSRSSPSARRRSRSWRSARSARRRSTPSR